MREMRCQFTKTAVLICATLVTLSSVSATDEFKNSVVNLKLDSNNNNNLKVTVVTNKPYTAPLVVNPKENNKYVILMPETKNVMSKTPNIDDTNTIKTFSIKTQPYTPGGYKGYTKIVITTTKPVNITPSIQVFSNIPQPNQKLKSASSKLKITKQKPKKNIIKKNVTKNKNTAKNIKIKQYIPHKKLIATPTAKPVIIKTHTKNIVAPKAKNVNISKKNIAKKVVKTPIVKATKQKPIIKNTSVKNNNIQKTKTSSKISKKALLAGKGKKLQTALTNLLHLRSLLVQSLLAFSAVGLPLAVLFYIVYINKKLKAKYTNTKPFSEDTDNNMVDTEPNPPIEPQIDTNNEVTNVNKTTIEENNESDNTESTKEEQLTNDKAQQEASVSRDDFVPQTLEEEPELLQEEDKILDNTENSFQAVLNDGIEEKTEDNENVSDETIEKAIPEEEEIPETKPEEEDITEDITEEIIDTVTNETVEEIGETEAISKTEQMVEQENIEEEEPVTEEGNQVQDIDNDNSISEINPTEEAITGDVNDEISNTIVPIDNNEETLRNDTDTITNEDSTDSFEDTTTIAPVQENEAIEAEPLNNYEPDGFINDFETTEADDSVFDELLNEPLIYDEDLENAVSDKENSKNLDNDNDEIFDDFREEYEVIDGLSVYTKTELDERSGFYLVNYENASSVIGYIDDDVFVLKMFDEFVNNKIYVKLADDISENVKRYILKTGVYKMVVEVTDTKMTHIIDL